MWNGLKATRSITMSPSASTIIEREQPHRLAGTPRLDDSIKRTADLAERNDIS